MKIRYAILLAAVLTATVSAPAAENKSTPVATPAELVALLQSNAPKAEKVKAFKPLAVYGNKDAVPALAAHLADEELASWARIALEAIPDPACDEALRSALPNLKGRLLVGVINSIGVRRDAKAVDLLAVRLADSDIEVAKAAVAALGRIGGDKADVPQYRALEGVRGAIVARGPDDVPMLVELLKSADKRRFALALKLTREVAAPELTDVLLAELSKASPARQALLLAALADRADPRARAVLLEAAKRGSGPARIAAIQGLKKVADISCVPILLDAALDDDASISATAADVLADLPLSQIDDLLVARLQATSGNGRLVLIDLVGRRHIEAATSLLFKLADDPEPSIREAVLTALGATISVQDLPILIARAVDQSKPEEAKAAEASLRAACTRMSDREALTAKVLEAMASAPVPAKCTLLSVLVTIGGDKALQAVAAAAKDPSVEIRRAGYKALGEWTTADAGPVLLDLVNSGDPELKIGALRGYIRVARQFVIPNAPRMAMFKEIMTLAQRDDERRLALDILRQIWTTESLATAVGYLDQPKLCDSAAGAAIAISERIVASRPKEVAAAMTQVIERCRNQGLVEKARALLTRAEKK